MSVIFVSILHSSDILTHTLSTCNS